MQQALRPYGRSVAVDCDAGPISCGVSLTGLLPEDRFDRQPIWNTDRSFCLVADVRLDNREDLARELNLIHPEEAADSTILMAAWLRWGEGCLEHIVGAFAFAVWIPSRNEIFAARDHTGERPLFYHRSERLFALASMPKGLLALPGVFRGLEEEQLVNWLTGLPLDWKKSCFVGIEQIPPAHFLRVTPYKVECRQYWDPLGGPPVRFTRDEDYAEALREILDRATAARLRTTMPVGSHLSAGLDSSAVAVSAAGLLAARGKRLSAFTSVPRPDFNDAGKANFLANEGPLAAEVADLYPNIDHVQVDTRGYELLHTTQTWTDAASEPALNLVNLLWFQAISDKAKQRGIGVMLHGAGGNGTISWESWTILNEFFRQGRWLKLYKTARNLRRNGGISIKAATRASLGDILPSWLSCALIQSRDYSQPLLHPELLSRYRVKSRLFEQAYNEKPDIAAERMYLFNSGDFGAANAAFMATSGLEFRDPTTDKRLYEYCFAIPPEQYLAGGHSRSLARRAMKDRLPDSIRLRYTRGRQGADWYLIMQEIFPKLQDELLLLGQSTSASAMVDLPRMQELLNTWPSSGYDQPPVWSLWHGALSRAFSLGYFLRSHERPEG
ncbi:MAG TPA: asparagine synthase-related protein [Acidobacteriaceae bacterium]|nr:asparagine synthase-related protein [Acidobacteriaceae bacterium]